MAKKIDHLAAVIQQMRDIKDNQQRLQERYDLLKKTVIDELGGETAGEIDGRPAVTYTQRTSRRFDTKAFSTAQPDVYDAFKVESTTHFFILVDPEVDNG